MMLTNSMNRRMFSRLTAAALSGVVAGAVSMNMVGCGQPSGTEPPRAASTAGPSIGTETAAAGEKHACAGLNGCKAQGADGKNACAGQGGCASTAMHHDCMGHNACKGQGGGEHAGENACKGQGGCAVPIKDESAWKMAREKFESKMKAAGKDVGPAPARS